MLKRTLRPSWQKKRLILNRNAKMWSKTVAQTWERSKVFLKYTFSSSVWQLKEDTLRRCSELVLTTLPSAPILPLHSAAEGIHIHHTCSLSEKHVLLVYIQHNFSKMQMSAALLDLPVWDKPALWADFGYTRGNFPHSWWLLLNHKSPYLWRVMPHPLQALHTRISHCNPTFLKCETAECYQVSLSLASGKTHMKDWKLRKLKGSVLWKGATLPKGRRLKLLRLSRLPEFGNHWNRVSVYLLKRVHLNTSVKTQEKAACSRGRHAMSEIKE